MALNTASSKLRTTILFPTRAEQVLFKRSAADLAESRGKSPSEAIARLPIEALAVSDLARKAAEVMYSDGGTCRKAYEAVFVEWSANPPVGGDLSVTRAFFDLCHAHDLCVDTTGPAIDELASLWEDAGDLLSGAYGGATAGARGSVRVRAWRRSTNLLRAQTPLLTVTPLLSLLIENWDELREEPCTYRILARLARLGRPSREDAGEVARDRLDMLGALDRVRE